MLTKEECLKALERFKPMNIDEYFKGNYPSYIEANAILKQLIEEHFDNPPLKYEELKEGMIVWDDYNKEFVRIDYLTMFNTWTYYNFNYVFPIELEFDENRFYRKKVEDE